MTFTLNGERFDVSASSTVADLLRCLSLKPEHVAVERNRELIARAAHAEATINSGDVLEVVVLIGGGAPDPIKPPRLNIGRDRFQSRLLVGTGK